MRRKELKGMTFGRLRVVDYAGCNKHGRALWMCKCNCGKNVIVSSDCLLGNHTKSCGCLNDEQRHKKGFEANRTKHNLHNTRLYRIWKQMKTRCYNQNTDDWKDYGGRGITVCQEWLDDFLNFYNWSLENGYNNVLTLDRIDVNGEYKPSNCRWSTAKHQANNKRSNHLITIDGETRTCAEWMELSGICHSTFYQRLRNGKTGYDLIAPPLRREVRYY